MLNLNKKLQKFNNKNIALLGLGLDNQSLLKLFDAAKIKSTITICDFKTKNKLTIPPLKNIKLKYQLGSSFNQNLYKFDLLFRSPGWPLSCPGIKKAKQKGQTEISSPLNLFFQLCPSKNIIGVTGSKGKGTTATLIYKILIRAKKRAWIGGNIGISPFNFLNKIKVNDYIVLELSSFQLEDLRISPAIAVITNLFPEHLAPADPHNPNFHSSYNKYWQAKLNIAQNPKNKYLVINNCLKTKLKSILLKSKIAYFNAGDLPTKLVGEYNLENIGAAVVVAKILKIPSTQYLPVIANFKNLEHRLKLIAKKHQVNYFDNSFSTTPESTILDLKSFNTPLILIAGGADKGANFKLLAKTIKQKVKFLVLLEGLGTERLKKELLIIKFSPKRMIKVNSMKLAILKIHSKVQPGDTVLLSTACASFGLFKNYKERGDLFEKYIRANIK
jgi:UDP-N-acetylmuramoylalanine--D-glutamate ligase